MVVLLSKSQSQSPRTQNTNQQTTSRFRLNRQSSTVELIGVFKRLLQQWDEVKLIKLEDNTTVRVPDPANELQADYTYRFHGKWHTHPKYGKQFKAESFAGDAPITRRGVIAFLSTECDHIGQATATRIWDKFGEKSITILRDTPEQISDAGILTLEQAFEAAECIKFQGDTQKTKVDLLGLFKGYGLGERAIQDALRIWGAKAATIAKQDPFKLMVEHVSGAGFKRCDQLYRDLGLPLNRLKRQMLKFWYELQTDSNGHTWFSWEKARDVNPQAIELGLRAKWLVKKVDETGRKWITESRKAAAESALASHLMRLASWTVKTGDQSRTNWPDTATIDNISDHQREELNKALSMPVAILAGSPGTGKTHCAAAIIKQLQKIAKVFVCAPTGKAAVRVQETLQNAGAFIQATTIHKLCRIQLSEDVADFASPDVSEGIDGFVVVDETSMVDVPLMAKLLSCCRTGTHILFLGDPYQLPPVGHGAPLRDMLKSEVVGKGELTEIRRNVGAIVVACKDIKEGKPFTTCKKYDPDTGENLRLIESVDADDTVAGVLKLHEIVARKDFHPVWDTQVLVAVNTKGPCSRVKLNKLLQDQLNPEGYTIEKHPFRVGDKVICLKNNKARVVKLKRSEHDDGTFEPLPDPRIATNYQDEVSCSTDTGNGTSNAPLPPTDEVYIANGELGKVIAVSRNQTIASFESPRRMVRILHGTVKSEQIAAEEKGTDANVTATDEPLEEKEPETGSDTLHYDLGYAITTHKSQGSESPCVIVVLDPLSKMICTREHLYTSISRAKKLCLLVGQRKVADEFCRKVALGRRQTHLASLLKSASAM